MYAVDEHDGDTCSIGEFHDAPGGCDVALRAHRGDGAVRWTREFGTFGVLPAGRPPSDELTGRGDDAPSEVEAADEQAWRRFWSRSDRTKRIVAGPGVDGPARVADRRAVGRPALRVPAGQDTDVMARAHLVEQPTAADGAAVGAVSAARAA